MALIRGAASSDPAIRAVFDSTRAAMAERIYTTHPPRRRGHARSSGSPSTAGSPSSRRPTINWFTTHDITRDDLVTLVTTALPAIATGAALTDT